MIFLSLFLCGLFSAASSTITLKPIPRNNTDLEAGLVFIQGEQIDANNYRNFSAQLQDKFHGKLWIAIAQFPQNEPNAAMMNAQINAAFDALAKQGFQITKDTPFFFAGHGIGGILLQDFLLNNIKSMQSKCKVSGLILEGAYVQRKNFAIQSVLNNILTIGGELDGLNRITRMAEAFYFNQKNVMANQITLIVNGMNHYQFSGDGQPPILIQQNDIQPEIENSQARDQVTSVLTSFMNISLNIQTDDDKRLISLYTQNTLLLLEPVIQAFKMDGHYRFNLPCYLDKKSKNCTKGCPWTSFSQQTMGSDSNCSIIGNDTFFKASQVSFLIF